MAGEIQIYGDFRDRMFEKIKNDMGSLMTDAELKQLVATAMERLFFTPEVERDRWGSEKERKPPRFEQLVKEQITPALELAIGQWLEAHSDQVKKQIDDALAGGLSNAVLRAMDQRMSTTFITLTNNLMNDLQARGIVRS